MERKARTPPLYPENDPKYKTIAQTWSDLCEGVGYLGCGCLIVAGIVGTGVAVGATAGYVAYRITSGS